MGDLDESRDVHEGWDFFRFTNFLRLHWGIIRRSASCYDR